MPTEYAVSVRMPGRDPQVVEVDYPKDASDTERQDAAARVLGMLSGQLGSTGVVSVIEQPRPSQATEGLPA